MKDKNNLNKYNDSYEQYLDQQEYYGVPKSETFNGWANYSTWNVAQWITNGETIYRLARPFRYKGYRAFVKSINKLDNQIAFQTPDGISWEDSELDVDALDELMTEL